MNQSILPNQYRCNEIKDFIGPARKAAELLKSMVEVGKQHGCSPISVLLLGRPGIGKSQLADFFCKHIGASQWSSHKYNGTSFRIDDVEDIARSVHYSNMFGDYRVIRIEEVDKMPCVAQVRMLTLLDDLPPANAVIATSNCRLNDLEVRFQRRFEVIQLEPPTTEEVIELLKTNWPQLDEWLIKQIAVATAGNVGAALKDANTNLCKQTTI